jgi:hypothetical protein
MPSAQYGIAISAGGVSISKSIVRTADATIGYEVTLPAAKAVTSWVKTDANTAACDLPSGHGYSNGNFDVYWSGGQRLAVPGTISTNALSLDGGTGTDFPASATSGVVVCRHVSINTTIDGDNVKVIGVSLEYADPASTSIGHILCEDASDNDIANIDLDANLPLVYDIEGGVTNPFTGAIITETLATHNNTSASATLKIVGVQDSTP